MSAMVVKRVFPVLIQTTPSLPNSMLKLSLLLLSLTSLPFLSSAFVSASLSPHFQDRLKTVPLHLGSLNMNQSNKNSNEMMCPHPFSQLPGDPSLLLVTNMDLGTNKLEIMKQCSKAISAATGKPESYIGTSLICWPRPGYKYRSLLVEI
jgi:hypothetical protein